MPVKKGSKQPKKYIDPNDDNDIYNSEEEYASKSKSSASSESGKSGEGTDDDDETTATTESDDTDIVSEYSGEFEDTEDDDDDDDDDDDETTQSGGDSDEGSENEVASTELGDDSNSLDTDPDEEMDQVDDDKYDPINDAEEVEDADVESVESVGGEDENEGNDEGEENEDTGIGEDGDGDGDGDGDPDGDGYTGETKQCHLKNLNKDFIVLDEDDSNMYGKMEYKRIADEDRESDNIMTYYEMVRVIGTRAQQFNFEAPPLAKGLSGLHVAKMAYIELIAKMTPYIIRRHLPGKKYEEWRIDELDIIHKITDDFFVPENFDWDALMKQAADLNKYKKEQIQIKASNKKK